MRPFETVSGMGERDKGEWWRGWIQLWCIVRTFVNVTIYSQYNNKKQWTCWLEQCIHMFRGAGLPSSAAGRSQWGFPSCWLRLVASQLQRWVHMTAAGRHNNIPTHKHGNIAHTRRIGRPGLMLMNKNIWKVNSFCICFGLKDAVGLWFLLIKLLHQFKF
jgi:hypothetical protein